MKEATFRRVNESIQVEDVEVPEIVKDETLKGGRHGVP